MDYQPKKKKKRPINYRRRWFYITLVLGLIVSAVGIISTRLFMSVDPSSRVFDATTIDVEGDSAIPQIERALEAPLLESATNIHFYYTSWLDYFMQIRFDLPQGDVTLFLDSISHVCLGDLPLQENLMPFGTVESKKRWWNPRSADQFVGVEQCGNNPYWQMLIDQTDDDIWIFYIIGYQE